MAVLAALAISVVSLGIRESNPASATVLDGFAINTQDKAVTVTLYTDQRAQYTTENQGKQFAIVLPQTELSKAQLENGLPVVIDNQNRFIGRAVPTEDGKVKIILPNLSAEDYTVSVQQQRPGQKAEAPALKPRPAVQNASQFEAVASSFPSPAAKPAGMPGTAPTEKAPAANVVRLTPNPALRSTSSNGTIWNPYVVKTTAPTTKATATEATPTRPASRGRSALGGPSRSASSINTLSVAESSPSPNVAPNDPLWYLHSLPPADPGTLPDDTLQGPAMNPDLPLTLSPPPAAEAAPAAPVVQVKSAFAEMKEAIQALPRWLLITLAVFLAGIGLFGLIGGLVLLRLLFIQARQSNGLAPAYAIYPAMMAPPAPEAAMPQPETLEKSAYATPPEKAVHKPRFEDKASISALDYLIESPRNVSEAVHNTVVLKFPSQKSVKSKRRLATATR